MIKKRKIINELFFILLLSLMFSANVYAQDAAVIDLDSTHQVIRGFGAANIIPWRDTMTTEEINTAFGTGQGQLGFSILRLRVPYEQSQFSLNVPTAQLAHSLGVTLVASPWSPPPEMKTNDDIVGGELEEEYYDDFAAHLDSFANYMAQNDAPISVRLYRNYPNPFNRSIRINFEIPERSFVSLVVYNLLGQEVAVLAEKEYSPGTHSVTFDASHLANGIYFYTLKAGDSKNTRKMFIMK